KALLFKDKYFQTSHTNSPIKTPSEDEVEKEFWRIVNDPNENIEVEYGTDIHTSIQTSPFPQIERDPCEEYSQDAWNLNVLPFNEKSYFRYVDADIPFMVQPWLSVGMVFASKSWHVQDYYSYGVSYHHFGEAKTHYSIPEEYHD